MSSLAPKTWSVGVDRLVTALETGIPCIPDRGEGGVGFQIVHAQRPFSAITRRVDSQYVVHPVSPSLTCDRTDRLGADFCRTFMLAALRRDVGPTHSAGGCD